MRWLVDDVTLPEETGLQYRNPFMATTARYSNFLPIAMAPIPATTAAADGGDNPAMPERSETGMRGDAVQLFGSKFGDSNLQVVHNDMHAVDSSEEELALINGVYSTGSSSSDDSLSTFKPPTAVPEGGMGEKRKWRETQDEGCCCCGSGEGVQRADCCYSGSSASDEEVSLLLAAIHHQAPRGLPSSSALYPFSFSSCTSSSFASSSSFFSAAEDVSYGKQHPQTAARHAASAAQHPPSASSAADGRQQQQTGETMLDQDHKRCWLVETGEEAQANMRSASCPQTCAGSRVLSLLDSYPRKRHCLVSSGDKRHNAGLQRPCLDFEKMQVSVLHFYL